MEQNGNDITTENVVTNSEPQKINKGMKKCKTCGEIIAKSAKVCPKCGGKQKKKKCWLIGILIFIVLLAAITNKGSKNEDNSNIPTSEATNKQVENDNINESNVPTASQNKKKSEKKSYENMTVGDIGKHGDLQIGLQYVKRMSFLPTALSEEKIANGNEVIMAFFEAYNESDKVVDTRFEDITCYADGVQIQPVETYIKVQVDGVKNLEYTSLDPGCQLISCQDFEVKKGWEEIKFFYKSDCVWTIHDDDVSDENYSLRTMFRPDYSHPITNEGEVIYSDEYEITYKGFSVLNHDEIFGPKTYVVFKLNITNNGDKALDTQLVGHRMRAYQDNISLGDADYVIDEKFDGYLNIFNVDSIEPGMSSNVYVIFEAADRVSDWHLVYNDGFIMDHVRGEVFSHG